MMGIIVMSLTLTTRATCALAVNLGLLKLQWPYYSLEYALLLLTHVSPKLDLVRSLDSETNCAIILARLCCLFSISMDPLSPFFYLILASGGWPLLIALQAPSPLALCGFRQREGLAGCRKARREGEFGIFIALPSSQLLPGSGGGCAPQWHSSC